MHHQPHDRTLTYQGRALPRPEDEVVDQGLAFDVGTLLSRRHALRMFGLGAAGLAVAACGGESSASTGSSGGSAASTTSDGEIPEETSGPYPGDGSNGPDVLEQSGIVRSDIRRGVQVADADGVVRFTSIFPACYDGRWPHIHFEVYPDRDSITDVANVIATSQVALPKNICQTVYAEEGYEASVSNLANVSLSSDGVFGDDGGASQLATVTGSVEKGYAVSLNVGVDTATTPGQSGGMGPGGGPGGGPPASR